MSSDGAKEEAGPTPTVVEKTASPLAGLSAQELLLKGNIRKFVEGATENFRIALDPSETLRFVLGELERHVAKNGNVGLDEESASVLAARRAFLLESGLHKMVGALVHRSDLNGDVSTGLLINTLFCRTLELLLHETDSEEAVTTVFKILNSELRFYNETDNSVVIKKHIAASKLDDVQLEFIDPKCPSISPFYLRVVNTFCRLKGFEVYRDRFAKNDPRVALPCFRLMLRSLFKMSAFVKHDYLKEHLARLKDPIVEQLSFYTENRNHDQGALYDSASETAMALLQMLYTEAELDAEFLEFQLKGSVANIRSNVLEKKLHGVRFVNSVVKRAQKWIERENAGRFAKLTSWLRFDDEENDDEDDRSDAKGMMGPLSLEPPRKKKALKPIDPKKVVVWLTDNKVLDELLQASAHEAVVKQAIPVLVFVASLDSSLDVKRYISLMWEISLDHHESVRSIIFSSIVHLSETLPLADVEFTYNLLKKLPLEKYDDQTLEFLRLFSTNANAKFGKEAKRFFGLEIYWSLFQDCEKVPTEVQKKASSNFSAVLEHDSCSNLVQSFLERLVELMREGHSLAQTLKLFARLSWVQESRKKKKTIEQLDEKLRVMDAFFFAIGKYKSHAVAATNTAGKFAPRYTHLQTVQSIFDWIHWVLGHSTLSLSAEQLDVLWKLFVEEQHEAPLEAEIMFKWLSVEEDKAGYVLKDKVIEHVLLNKMLAKEFYTNLSGASYRAFRRFFLFHNLRVGSIRKSGLSDRFVVSGTGTIVGLDAMWAIALDSRGEDVSTQASELLNDLFLFPHQKGQGLREAHISRCMKALDKDATAFRVLRALRMLADMHETYDKIAKGKPAPTHSGGGVATTLMGGSYRLNLFVRIDVGNGFLLADVDSSTTVEQLKKMIGDRLGGMSGMFMRLFVDEKELTSPKSTLTQARIVDKTEVVVRQSNSLAGKDEIGVESLGGMLVQAILKGIGLRPAAPNAAAVAASSSSSSSTPVSSGIAMRLPEQMASSAEDSFGEFSPAIIMSQEKHFDNIFSLLSHSDARIVAASWRLLDHLPVAPALRSAFSESAPDFAKLLQIGTSYRLVYSLQVLESMIQAVDKAKARLALVKGGAIAALQKLLTHNCTVSLMEDAAPAIRLLSMRIIRVLLQDEESRVAASPGLESLLVCLADALKCVALSKQTTPEDVEMSGRLADAWSSVLTSKVNVSAIVPDFDEWIKNVLLHAVSDQIRAQAQRCLAATTHPETFGRVVKVLVDLLPDSNKWGPRAVQLMALLEAFARERGVNEDLAKAVPVVAQVVMDRPIVEESIDSGNEDWSLCAMLSLLASILATHPELKPSLKTTLLPHLFWNCLFALPDAHQITEKLQPPKCKTNFARSTAMRLLTEICRGCPENYLTVTAFVWEQGLQLTEKYRNRSSLAGGAATAGGKPRGPVALLETRKDGGFSASSEAWMLTPMGDLKPRGACVGLQNLGATCYMNSLLQQLFYAPGFADGILSVPLISLNELAGAPPPQDAEAAATAAEVAAVVMEEEKEIEGDKDGGTAPNDPFGDHLLAQLQTVVCNLRYSNRKYFNTRPFANSNKDMDGRPINTGLQQDAIEYFNSLFERLEFYCGKDKRQHRFLKEIFGGTLSNQLICKDGCTHSRERKEPFYSISVEVKNKDNLYKSLELYVEGEMLEGENAYFCEDCSAKRPTLKRAVLHGLPNVLVVHLKRFEFSYETLTHSKLNSYFEFPEMLDVFPYTDEGLIAQGDTSNKRHPDSYYQYRLRGVVIHAGGASAGHYYSLIKDSDTEQWREFNDSNVRPFEFQNMKEEAFGGMYTAIVRDSDTGGERTVQRERINNAYLLVYERVEKFPFLDEEPPNNEEINAAAAPLVKNDPSGAIEKVLQDNVSNLHGRYMSSAQYYQWLWEFLNLYSTDAEGTREVFLKTLSLSLFLLLHVMGRTRDSVMGSIWSGHVARMCSASKAGCDWLFRRLLHGGLEDESANPVSTNHFHYLFDFLTRCPRPRTRMALAEVLEAAMRRSAQDANSAVWMPALFDLSHFAFSSPPPLELTEWLRQRAAPQHVLLVEDMLGNIASLAGHSLQFMAQYFRVLRSFAEIGVQERRYLVSRGAVEFLMELVQLKGRFKASKVLGDLSRHVKSCSGAVGCAAEVLRGAALPLSDAVFAEIVGDSLMFADGPKDGKKGKKKAVAGSGGGEKKNPLQRSAPLIELPAALLKEVIGREVVQKLCEERWALSELLEISELLVFEDERNTDYFMLLIADGLKRAKTVEGLGGYLSLLEGLLLVGDSLSGARSKNAVSLLMSLMDRAMRSRTKPVAASEVTKYQLALLNSAKNSLPSHPLRKLVLAREREIQDMRAELSLKPLVFSDL